MGAEGVNKGSDNYGMKVDQPSSRLIWIPNISFGTFIFGEDAKERYGEFQKIDNGDLGKTCWINEDSCVFVDLDGMVQSVNSDSSFVYNEKDYINQDIEEFISDTGFKGNLDGPAILFDDGSVLDYWKFDAQSLHLMTENGLIRTASASCYDI
jgi:hypothetical protein